MKGEYAEHNTETPPTMLPSKLHHHHLYLSSPDTTNTSKKPAAEPSATGGDGSSIEVVRRPRGRPRGSKNKPKPPVVVTRNPEAPMSPFILEIPSGADVFEAIRGLCRRKRIGICVLSGSGAVSNVTLRQPSPAAPGSTVTFRGKFDVLSVSTTLLPPSQPAAVSPPVSNQFSISLAGPQGQIVGGFVAGPLVAAGTMYLVAASFNNPSYHRLPIDDDDPMNSGSAEAGEGNEQAPQAMSSGGEKLHAAAVESCGVSSLSIYGCPLGGGSDGLWSPTARAQPPPY